MEFDDFLAHRTDPALSVEHYSTAIKTTAGPGLARRLSGRREADERPATGAGPPRFHPMYREHEARTDRHSFENRVRQVQSPKSKTLRFVERPVLPRCPLRSLSPVRHAPVSPPPDEDADDGFLAQGPAGLQTLKAFDQNQAFPVPA